MNNAAQEHLAKAKDYIAKGDEFYRKAKPEIEAAIASGVSQVEAARILAVSRTWLQDVLKWDGTGTLYGKDTERRQDDMAKQVLRDSEPEKIAAFFDDPKIGLNVAKAAVIHEEQTQQREEQGQLKRAKGLVSSYRVHGALSGLVKAKVGLASTLREIQRVPDFREDDREDFIAIVEEIRLELGWIESFLTAGTTDFDAELASILEEK